MKSTAIQKGTGKEGRSQVMLKGIGQFRQAGHAMIMANRAAGLLPDLLLGIESRCSHGKLTKVQTRMSRQEVTEGRATMPGGAIPE